MESFEENKIFGDVFCRYLQNKFGWLYEVANPQNVDIPSSYPDVDVVLVDKDRENLYLQFKQPIQVDRVERILTRSNIKPNQPIPLEDAVKKAENRYFKQNKDINNIILILHVGLLLGYSVPEDAKINGEIKSNFRGIYFVSPEHNEVWHPDEGKKNLKEFVVEIKKAF